MASLDLTPNSLGTLGRNSFEKAATQIHRWTYDAPSNIVTVSRGTSANLLLKIDFSLSLDAASSWKYAVGSENVAFFLALRKALLDDSLSDVRMLRGGTSIDTAFGIFRSGDAYEANLTTSVNNVLNRVFDESDKVDTDIEQQIYGDQNYSASDVLIRNDVIFGSPSKDTLLGLLGNDLLYGEANDDFLYGGFGDDVLHGGSGNDYLYGQENNDRLFGDNGDDYLDGGLGEDFMSGGEGNDTYVVDNPKDDIRDNGLATDKDEVLVPLFVRYKLAPTIENARLSGSHDGVIRGNLKNNTVIGNDGNNKFWGASGKDRLKGGSGNDTLFGQTGADQILGGTDDDKLFGGLGGDRLVGGTGNDLIAGGLGNDVLLGGHGSDTFQFGKGFGKDKLSDFEDGLDRIEILSGAKKFGDLHVVQQGDDTIISFSDVTILVRNFDATDFSSADFIFS